MAIFFFFFQTARQKKKRPGENIAVCLLFEVHTYDAYIAANLSLHTIVTCEVCSQTILWFYGYSCSFT